MRALTLTQPWCGLVASGIKLIENRPRPMIKRADFGKPFALHASRQIDGDVLHETLPRLAPDLFSDEEVSYGLDWRRLSTITSAVIAVATLVDVLHIGGFTEEAIATEVQRAGLGEDQVRWAFGPIAYVLRDVRALGEPVPCKGALGFWQLPAEVEERVGVQLPDQTPPGDPP